MMNEKVKELAQRVKEAGGRLLLVGGFVRDELLGRESKDFDCEVYRLTSDQLEDILQKFNGKVNMVGKSFGVYKVGSNIDVSLPRTETKVGEGHKGFRVESDPFLSYRDACLRRDFTINAIMKDPLTMEYIDPFDGARDLSRRILRMTSPRTFQEDPLRVLRLAQFAHRFGFEPEAETLKAALSVDLSSLSLERVFGEFEKVASRLDCVGGFHQFERLGVFRKLGTEITAETSNFTFLDSIKDDYSFSNKEDVTILKLALLLPDEPFGSEEELLKLGVAKTSILKSVLDLRMAFLDFKDRHYLRPSRYFVKKLATHFPKPEVFSAYLSVKTRNPYRGKDYMTRVVSYGVLHGPEKPLITGKDLIALGLEPSPKFKRILDWMYDAQLVNPNFNMEDAKTRIKELASALG